VDSLLGARLDQIVVRLIRPIGAIGGDLRFA
jgi:hypothetical protein